MQHWESFCDKGGFGDGSEYPPGVEQYREVYLAAINRILELENRSFRLIPYDRSGVHNVYLWQAVTKEYADYYYNVLCPGLETGESREPEAVSLTLPDTTKRVQLDWAIERANELGLDEFVLVEPIIDNRFGAFLTNLRLVNGEVEEVKPELPPLTEPILLDVLDQRTSEFFAKYQKIGGELLRDTFKDYGQELDLHFAWAILGIYDRRPGSEISSQMFSFHPVTASLQPGIRTRLIAMLSRDVQDLGSSLTSCLDEHQLVKVGFGEVVQKQVDGSLKAVLEGLIEEKQELANKLAGAERKLAEALVRLAEKETLPDPTDE
jgi:hypothetical protein